MLIVDLSNWRLMNIDTTNNLNQDNKRDNFLNQIQNGPLMIRKVSKYFYQPLKSI